MKKDTLWVVLAGVALFALASKSSKPGQSIVDQARRDAAPLGKPSTVWK